MDKGVVSYKHKVGMHEKEACATLLPGGHDHAPLWACIKHEAGDKICLSMGHIGSDMHIKMHVHSIAEIKSMLDSVHLMVHKFEEEVAKWEQINPTHK